MHEKTKKKIHKHKEPLTLDLSFKETEEDCESIVEPDLSGWQPHPSERRDFYHRPRAFPPEVTFWRRKLISAIIEGDRRFKSAPGMTPEEIQEKVDQGISYLRELARILALLHGNQDLGNKKDPTDELVYIILARHTQEDAYQKTYQALKDRFSTWDELLKAQRKEIVHLIHPGGLSSKKTITLISALEKLRETFGTCTLEPARDWTDEKLEEFLCSLPEIQQKTAFCIMMYSFGRHVFPADTHVGRVLARLGLYQELGLNLTGLDHKKLQAALQDLIPPNLRYSLHVNLVIHGRTVCLASRPRCENCDIRKFCQKYRNSEVEKAKASKAPTVVDLFCGAGGMSEGFTRAGFRTLLALDQNREAMRTYKLNHPAVPDDRILVQDIRQIKRGTLKRLVGSKPLDVLVGSPPCQGFSSAGFRSKRSKTGYKPNADERNFLYEDMVAIALELRPRLFLMENVPGMHSVQKDKLSFLESAGRALEEKGGYKTEIWRLNATSFGVPQDRIRCFLVASNIDLFPARPVEDYQDIRRQDLDLDALPPVGLQEAIFDLPILDSGAGVSVSLHEIPDYTKNSLFRRYLTKFNLVRKSKLIFNHTVRYHNPRDLELYALLRQGEDSIHALERHGRGDLMRYRRDVFDDKYARLRADRPCKTIVAHLAKDGNGYIHPTQVRSISLREAARVQSFPDSFVFCGTPSDQWIQVGNAVPPVLAEAIARTFLRTLNWR